MEGPVPPRPGLRLEPALAAARRARASRASRRLALALGAYGALFAGAVLLAGLGAARWPLLVLVGGAFLLPLAVLAARPRAGVCPSCGGALGSERDAAGREWAVCAACGACAPEGSDDRS